MFLFIIKLIFEHFSHLGSRLPSGSWANEAIVFCNICEVNHGGITRQSFNLSASVTQFAKQRITRCLSEREPEREGGREINLTFNFIRICEPMLNIIERSLYASNVKM